MITRRYGTSLHRSARGDVLAEEDANPNSYITNIADCMLVLVLGLLVALVSRYGLELAAPEEESDEIIGIQMDLDADQDGVIDSRYESAGTVYYDPDSGNYYLVED